MIIPLHRYFSGRPRGGETGREEGELHSWSCRKLSTQRRDATQKEATSAGAGQRSWARTLRKLQTTVVSGRWRSECMSRREMCHGGKVPRHPSENEGRYDGPWLRYHGKEEDNVVKRTG